jgi:hypothetical protein
VMITTRLVNFYLRLQSVTKDDDALDKEKEGASGERGMQGRVSGPRRAGGSAVMCRRH